ncbi:TIGR03084 family metal-binding protein [Nocardioides sp. W7]|uniref:TIGR03084 family metal-binding protein n=1 Tax=Nocardioides sp. W7 TaxID=2931390 RepID=UPI001FD47325|nr:TIGR03084 family metal-binding protein [Nocardioides sp. W7]
MTLLDDLLDDLRTEGDGVWNAVAGLDEDGWATPTPAVGWSVATQVAHLVWTDEVAVVAATDRERWDALVHEAMSDPSGYVDAGAHEIARLAPIGLLARWGTARTALVTALRAFPTDERMPWFGPPMSPTSMATARFMETWAHGLDVYDALGIDPERTDRIRHVAHLGVRTRGYAYAMQGEQAPAEEPRVQLTAPSGSTWSWGPEDARQSVTGSAYDFCLLVTQRVHRDDTDLVAVGDDAEHWLRIAQCFAGPPGAGRAAR